MEDKLKIRIFVEGRAGSGKTTIISKIAETLSKLGFNITVFEEPGFPETLAKRAASPSETDRIQHLTQLVDVEILQIPRSSSGDSILTSQKRSRIADILHPFKIGIKMEAQPE